MISDSAEDLVRRFADAGPLETTGSNRSPGDVGPQSRAEVGITELRGMKLGMRFPVHPLEDSDAGMERYLRSVKRSGDGKMADFLGILMVDEDSLPCVRREWRLAEFDEELVDLCARAWLQTSETLVSVLRWLGENPPPQTLSCRSGHQAVLYKTYNRETLIQRLADMPDPDLMSESG